MNKYILILLLFFSGSVYGQGYPNTAVRGNLSTLDSAKGPITSATGVIITAHLDTTTVNALPYFKNRVGATFYSTSDNTIYTRTTAYKWEAIGTGGGGGSTDTTVAKFPLYVKQTVGQKDSLGVYGVDSSYQNGVVVNDNLLRLYRFNGDSSDFVIRGSINSDSLRKYIPREGTASDGGGPVTGDVDVFNFFRLKSDGPTGLFGIEYDEGTVKIFNDGAINPDAAYIVTSNAAGVSYSSEDPTSLGFTSDQYFPSKDPNTYAQMKDIADSMVKVKADSLTLATAINGKEPALGNPSISGQILSSTTGGVRSWVSAPTGTLANNRGVLFNNGGLLKDTSTFVYTGGFLGLNVTTPTSLLHLKNDNIGVGNNYDKGILLSNATAATVSVLQESPGIVFDNHYYRGMDQTQKAKIYGLSESGSDVYGGIGMAVDGTNIFNFRRRISGSNIAAFGWNLELSTTTATWTSPNGGTTFQNAASIFTSAASRHVVGIKVGANTNPVASALVDMESTTKGFLPPRMTQAQASAIASPALGLSLFNTSDSVNHLFSGNEWNPEAVNAYRVVTGSTTLSITNRVVSVNNGASNVTITLPAASTCSKIPFIIKRFDNTSTGTITVQSSSGNVQSFSTMTFGATTTLSAVGNYGQTQTFISNTTNFEVLQ